MRRKIEEVGEFDEPFLLKGFGETLHSFPAWVVGYWDSEKEVQLEDSYEEEEAVELQDFVSPLDSD